MSPAERARFLGGLLRAPYALGGDGPARFDCWGLAVAVERDLFARALPRRDHGFAAAVLAMREARWRRVAGPPVDGDLVLAGPAQARHIGVWLAPEGGVLHAYEGVGVVFERPAVMMARGFAQLTFYRPAKPRAIA